MPDLPVTRCLVQERKPQPHASAYLNQHSTELSCSRLPNSGTINSGQRFEKQNRHMYVTELKRHPLVRHDRKGKAVGEEPSK